VADGGDRGGHDDPLDVRGQRRLDHAQGAVAGRDDQVVWVLGLLGRERRRDVQHVVTARDGLGPAVVGAEVGGGDGQVIARVDAGPLDRRAHRRLARDVPDRRADLMAAPQQLGDAPAAEETRPSGDEDRCARVAHDLCIIADVAFAGWATACASTDTSCRHGPVRP
jgi:hypothetical protein